MRTVALTIFLALVTVAPASASFPDNSALLFSSPDDFVGKGFPRLYTDNDATFTVSGSASDLTVFVTGTNSNGSFALRFAARSGSVLKPGSYKNVERAAGVPSNRAGMSITGNGAGCNTVSGDFEVKDIGVDSSGQVQRVKILYEQHCEGAPAALFGEVRVGETVSGPAAAVTPSELRWPAVQLGAPADRAGVSLLVTRPMASIAAVSVTGPDAELFTPRNVSCGGSCPPGLNGPFDYGDVTGVGMDFTPDRPGTRAAMLHILDSNGDTYDVPLRGSVSR